MRHGALTWNSGSRRSRRIRVLLFSFALCLGLFPVSAQGLSKPHNKTVPLTASQIVWTPPPCNNPSSTGNCTSAWWFSNQTFGQEVVTTLGPTSPVGNTIPQMFLSFQGSAIYLRTSFLSTALANISVSWPSNLSFPQAEAVFNTSDRRWGASGLPENALLLLSLTYTSQGANETGKTTGRLDIEEVEITVSSNTSSTVNPPLLPSLPLSTASSPSPLSPTSASASTIRTHRGESTGAIIAECFGAVFGVILLVGAGAGVVFWRRKSMRRKDAESYWDDADRGKVTGW